MPGDNRRHTRAAIAAARSCYDRFCLGVITHDRDLCCNCFDYKAIPVKNKSQVDMGRRFQCRWPEGKKASTNDNSFIVVHKKKRPASKDNNDENATPAPKKRRSSIQQLQKKLSSTEQKLSDSNGEKIQWKARYNDLLTDSAASEVKADRLEARLKELESEVITVKAKLAAAEEQVIKANSSERRLYKKLSNLEKLNGVHDDSDPINSSLSLVKIMTSNGFSDEDIVKGFLAGLCEKKKTRQHIAEAILDSTVGSEVSKFMESRFYKTIQEKFALWKCLLHLDLEACVSFRALNIIRKIEFYGEEKSKYRRGIINERTKLSRIAKELETYGKELLPYELTKTCVKFDIEKATTFLLKKFGLWDFVMSDDKVLLAATVDGGQLAWKLTQISAGIKLVDPRSINPRTGELLFGETGVDNVQSSTHCFPLYVYIAKDNKDFYDTHLTSFFSKLNKFEDDHSSGLQLAYPADMCSQCKTVRQGGAMKLSTYGCYCCGVHKNDLAKANSELCADCIRLGRTQCYHHDVLVEDVMLQLHEEKADLIREFPHLHHYPFKKSRIKVGSSIGDGSADPRHIEFEPRTVQQRIQHNNLIQEELRLRGIPFDALSPHERRLMLHELLISEWRYSLLKGVLEAKTKEDAMILLEKAVPCILHLENRVSECLICMLLLKALSYLEDDNHALNHYILQVEKYMNESIFREPDAPSVWKFPHEENKLGDVKFSNW